MFFRGQTSELRQRGNPGGGLASVGLVRAQGCAAGRLAPAGIGDVRVPGGLFWPGIEVAWFDLFAQAFVEAGEVKPGLRDQCGCILVGLKSVQSGRNALKLSGVLGGFLRPARAGFLCCKEGGDVALASCGVASGRGV